MNWNHRIVKYVDKDFNDCPTYVIVEIFYDEDGKPQGFTEPFLTGESTLELKELCALFLKATMQPIILVDDDDNIIGEEPNGN